MRNKFFAALLITAAVLCAAAAFAAETVPGDVLVIFKNSAGAAKVSAASLKANGEHGSYVASVASSMQARVANTYETFSEDGDSVFVLMHSDTKSEQELLAELRARPDVQGASLNHISKLTAVPNDRYYSEYPDANGKLWGLKAIRANEVWDAGHTGSDSVYAAVIDTGITANHEDLKGNVATEYCNGFDAEGKATGNYADGSAVGHGTHVSGTIGAVGDNGKGVVGVNWKTKIIMLRCLQDGAFPDSAIIAALQDVVRLRKDNVNIAALNISLGGWANSSDGEEIAPDKISNSSHPLWAALRAVSDAGVVLCVAASNESQRVGYPAPCDAPADDEGYREYLKGDYIYPASFRNIPNMIVVAAASQDVTGRIIRSTIGNGEGHSNYGSEYVDIAAPGSCIVSTVLGDYGVRPDAPELSEDELVEPGVKNYASFPGTSMATPHVTGAVALLKSAYPNATAEQIKQAILYGANPNYCKDDKDSVTYTDGIERVADGTSKYGFLDVKKAYDLLPRIIASSRRSGNDSSNGCDAVLGSAGALLALALLIRKFS